LRHQIASFFAYKSSGQPFDVEISALVLHIVTEILDGQTENTDMTDGQPVIDEWKQICENKDKVFSVFIDEIKNFMRGAWSSLLRTRPFHFGTIFCM
jgi:hypothetical protein